MTTEKEIIEQLEQGMSRQQVADELYKMARDRGRVPSSNDGGLLMEAAERVARRACSSDFAGVLREMAANDSRVPDAADVATIALAIIFIERESLTELRTDDEPNDAPEPRPEPEPGDPVQLQFTLGAPFDAVLTLQRLSPWLWFGVCKPDHPNKAGLTMSVDLGPPPPVPDLARLLWFLALERVAEYELEHNEGIAGREAAAGRLRAYFGRSFTLGGNVPGWVEELIR